MPVHTVLGPIDASDLGPTLPHEHIGVRTPGIAENWPDTYDRAAHKQAAIEQVQAAYDAGIRTIVDPAPADLGRDVGLMQEVARETGMQIVCVTGIYWIVPRYWWGREPDDLADAFVREIEQGIADTGVHPGAIKAATDEGGVTEVNEKCLRAIARAHRRTGIPIITHNGPPTMGREQQRVFLDEGVDLKDNVVIGHVGDTDDVTYLRELADRGSFLGLDRFGIDQTLSFEARVDTVVRLCAAGYTDRIVLAHDRCCALDWVPNFETAFADAAPNWRMNHVSEDVVPALRERGVSDAQIQEMLVDNPRRLLEPGTPY
ncbi:MAG TPA: phosphotriesterase-related protein [Dehalococcoidia bacterium]|nr:phosphotriesterase-related protein [Dehalococcoidia bacterium]